MSDKNTSMDELLSIMERLRDPEKGCPWDKKQTLASIVPHTIEEAYEVAEAIESNDVKAIKSEVADLLLQVLFYCQIGSESGMFDFDSVAAELKEKLMRRHPHIFANQQVNEQDHHAIWETIKEKERQEKSQESVLAGVAHNLPALLRAQKLQARAARVGFDWPHINFVLDKMHEEIEEFKVSYNENDFEATKEELGDILFVCANLARHVKSDAESILRAANKKFERRFGGVEQKVLQSGKSWDTYTLDDLDAFWDEVKEQE